MYAILKTKQEYSYSFILIPLNDQEEGNSISHLQLFWN